MHEFPPFRNIVLVAAGKLEKPLAVFTLVTEAHYQGGEREAWGTLLQAHMPVSRPEFSTA